MKRLIPFVVLTMLAVSCGGGSDDPAPTEDTTQPDTSVPDTVEPDTTEPDTTTTPDVTLPTPDVTLPTPDTAIPDTATVDTGGPTVPAESCRVGLDCALSCDDKACQDACLEGMDIILWENAGAALVCQEDKCNDSKDTPCLLDKCYDDFSACYFDGKTGENDCKDTKICVEKEGCDDACIDTCLQSATLEAQTNYIKLAFCVKDQCGDNPDFDCQKQAELNICSTQWAHCYDF